LSLAPRAGLGVHPTVTQRFPARLAASLLPPLGLLAFWIGIIIAARLYPTPYDWQYTVVSNLFSPRRDPAGHIWASAGVVMCSLCALAWASIAQRQWRRAAGLSALQLGSFCMLCSSMLPGWLLRVTKAHEMLALVAFTALCLGIVHLTFLCAEWALLEWTRGSARQGRLSASLLAGAAVLPILFAGLAQLYVFYALPELHWVSRAWRANGIPVYLSFAFWEWITCALLSAYIAAISLATHKMGSGAYGPVVRSTPPA
jgi:hypothetical protein